MVKQARNVNTGNRKDCITAWQMSQRWWATTWILKDSKILKTGSWIKIDQFMWLALFFASQHVSNVSTFIFRSLWLCVSILLWFDVCWRYGVVRLGWCGNLMQAKALVPTNWCHLLYFLLLNMFRMLVHSSAGACDCVWVYCSGSMCVGVTVWFGWVDVVSLCRLRH